VSDLPNALKSIVTPVRLEYDHSAGAAATGFLRGLTQKKILGARTGPGEPVLVPPRGADPRTSELAAELVEVSDKGTVVTYSIVRVPSDNIPFELPYVCATVLLDGANLGFFHVLQNCALDQVRIGMRVQAQWAPDDELTENVSSIRYFEPIDEPDVPFEQIEEYA